MSPVVAITLNGQSIPCAADTTLADVVRAHVPHPGACAVAMNGQVIPRSRLHETPVQPGDAVEIVRAVGGG